MTYQPGHDYNWPTETNPTVSPTVTPMTEWTGSWQTDWEQWFKPTPCSCEYTGMHTWLGHWFRLLWMRRTW